MVDKKESSVWVVGQIATAVEPAIVHRESNTQLSIVDALALILNKLERIEKK